METITVLGLLLIGIGLGFILTKGYQLHKSIEEESKKAKEQKEKKE